MFLAVQKDVFAPSQQLTGLLVELARLANNLYNQGVYESRQYFFANGRKPFKALKYTSLYAALKGSENGKLLHSQAAQQVLKSVSEAFKSFKALSKLFKLGELDHEPKLPRYRTKGGLYQVVFTGQSLQVEDGLIRVPLGRGGAAAFAQECFYIPLPGRLKDVQIRELRFIPANGQWIVEYVYPSMDEPATSCKLHPENVLALDPGLNNLLAGVTNTGLAFVLDGKALKSRNQWYNKRVAELKSILTHGKETMKGATSKAIQLETHKRNCYVRDYINKAARWVIDFCLENSIDNIVYGRNKGQKDGVNLGSKTNQEFVQIPHYKLFRRIQQLALIFGIRVVETEESYTSQASFFDNDILPVFGEKPEGWMASGKRIVRGLYRSAKGWLLNSDCHGSCNIMRKVSTSLGIDLSGVCRGAVAAPFRVKLTPAGFSLT
jgi:putative transposase